MKVAFVYDRVNKIGGAERILEVLHQIWPKAPLFTAVYDKKKALWAKDFKIYSSFLQRFPYAKSHHEFYPWLTPLAFESFSFDEFEVVISLTSAEAKGIITKPGTLHICYCLTPTRYLWIQEKSYLQEPGFGFLDSLARLAFRVSAGWLRKWDKMAAMRPDYYLAISERVKRRIKRYYQRDSEVIYPPVDLKQVKSPSFAKATKGRQKSPARHRYAQGVAGGKVKSLENDYFLIVSRLVSYKRVDLAIEAFNHLGLPLKIVGVGNLEKSLKKKARKNITFLGQLTDKELVSYYHNCQALIMPQEEDFGLVALEAQAAGRPVITFKDSGAAEVILEGKTGESFARQNVDSLIKIVRNFKVLRYKPETCRQNAAKYGQEKFKKKFIKFIEDHGKIS